MIGIIDYGMSNLHSVKNACDYLNLDSVVSKDVSSLSKCDKLILPGVGAFQDCMNTLHSMGLYDFIVQQVKKDVPLLGICLGMQILFEKGYEVKETKGLGFIPGSVRYMDIDEKIPHMGWNQLHITNHQPILKYVHENDDAYFVHSYMAHCKDENLVAYTDYGTTKVTALVQNKNVIGCQFHPEKSGMVGHKILLAFKEMVEC